MNNPVIVVENVSKSFGGRCVLENISFQVGEGEILGLFGPNGGGKSVLLRLLATLEKPDSGKIMIKGFDVFEKGHQILKTIYFLSDSVNFGNEYTVTDIMEFLISAYQVEKHQRPAWKEVVLEKSGLLDYRDCQIKGLSTGYRQRLRLAPIYLPHFKIFLLDEPFKDLDDWRKKALILHIREMAREGKTILIATHFIEELKSLAHRILMVKDGKLENL
ncbi:MAG: ABC transporter ATP-binding protein [Candidatus Tectomicrobia bacterium]|uniref:ABC transporter ATP-binding protein n=1 Tax=Tectimicrobiota bacterium TaxID=2528274 RepID=A0A933GKF6_UNCTE|nr:ABC transporter ATP-binding protein [Candidatus Tectomicrobia bacterium]